MCGVSTFDDVVVGLYCLDQDRFWNRRNIFHFTGGCVFLLLQLSC